MVFISFAPDAAKRWETMVALGLAACGLLNLARLTGRFGDDLQGSFWTALFLTGAGLIEIMAGFVLRRRRSGYQSAVLLALAWALNLTGLLSILLRLGYPGHLVYLLSSPNLNSPVWYDAVFFGLNLGLTFLLTFHLAGLSPARLKSRSPDYWSGLLILAGSGLSLYIVTFSGGLLTEAGLLDALNLAFALNMFIFSLMMAILFLKVVRPRPC